MNTLHIATPVPGNMPTLHIKQALNQLTYVWPGLMRRHAVFADVVTALAQIDDNWIAAYRAAHPTGRHATVCRVGRHEVQVRDLHLHAQVSVHWIDHPRLVGRGIAYGIHADSIEAARSEDRARRRALMLVPAPIPATRTDVAA